MVPRFHISLFRLMPVLLVALLAVGCSKHVISSTEDMAMVMPGPAAGQSGVVGQLDMGGASDMGGTSGMGGSAAGSGEIRVSDQAIAMAPASSSFSQAAESFGASDAQGSAGLGDVFFDFDKFSLPADAPSVLNGDASLLKEKNGVLVIAGHCDEWGTSAYNLVLGEKRARSAMHYLKDLGVASSRMRVVSYGKEKPFCQDHNAECWKNNRRAHFSIR